MNLPIISLQTNKQTTNKQTNKQYKTKHSSIEAIDTMSISYFISYHVFGDPSISKYTDITIINFPNK